MKTTEDLVLSALAKYFDWNRNHCFPCTMLWEWEQDMVVVTPAKKVWEIEVKLSRGDWQADSKKPKWVNHNMSSVSRFYYCVPHELLENGVPGFVPEWAGVLEFSIGPGDKVFISEHRPAKNRSTFVLAQAALLKLYRSTYYRFWRCRKHDPMHGCFEHLQSIAEDLDVVAAG